MSRGDYAGDHWRIGGQTNFEAPARSASILWIEMRVDGLADADPLRLRLIDTAEAEHNLSLIAVLVGGALILLVLGAIYSPLARHHHAAALHGLACGMGALPAGMGPDLVAACS